MESNFIKERTVVREQLIKKNLKSDKKPLSSGSASSPANTSYENPPERVVVLEEVVNERLKQQLLDISRQVDTVCQTISDYLKVKSALKVFKSNPKDVRVQTNLGCNFYAQCHIEDASKVYLCIGKDYYLHLGLDEALVMIDFIEKQWTNRLDLLQLEASRIKAYIKVALEAMGRVYEVDRDKLISE